MSNGQHKKKVVRVSAAAKDNVTTRVDEGKVVATNSPNSPISQQNQEVATTAQNLVAATNTLEAKNAKVKALEAELATERTALGDLTVDWDTTWGIFVSTAKKYCKTDQDAQSLGLAAMVLVAYALAKPVEVIVKWDAKKALIRIHVKRPKGLRSVRIEISPDPVTATSWKQLDGDGATAALSGYAPGTWWVRAAMVRARQVSEYTVPVAVIVK
jgi:hypothetical protein